MLELKGIKKFYNRFLALDDLNLKIEEGALFGFVGPNGAGKTTAIKIMAGLLTPTEGVVTINGETSGVDNENLKKMTGYIPDSPGIYRNLKVSEYMEFFANCSGLEGLEARKRCESLLTEVGLLDREDFYVEALSRGMKQRLSLARALIKDPPVLLMDEPASGLDPRTRYEFKQIISELCERGKTIVISSHILADISELCTDVAIIDQGKIVMNGKLNDVMNQVTAGNPIVISLSSKVTQAVRLLREEPLVSSLSIKHNDIMIRFGGRPKDEAELLKKLVEAGLPVRNFSREKGSLESIFMQLTGSGEDRIISSSDDFEEE
ncbi:MAG: ABC transporter ATP-binding protein [Eubacteriales bacterium]|nr:ABC transporter ATP-binding protein [Eubacteriales bacterium]